MWLPPKTPRAGCRTGTLPYRRHHAAQQLRVRLFPRPLQISTPAPAGPATSAISGSGWSGKGRARPRHPARPPRRPGLLAATTPRHSSATTNTGPGRCATRSSASPPAGGNVGRFAGNFYWQIRLEAGRHPPESATNGKPTSTTRAPAGRLTANWEDPVVGRPGAPPSASTAASASTPASAGWSRAARPASPSTGRSTGRSPGADLYYGDILGTAARIFGYEVDGLDYLVQDGLPFPTETAGAPEGLEIIALGLATNTEADHGKRGSGYFNMHGDPALEVMPLRYAGRTRRRTAPGPRAAAAWWSRSATAPARSSTPEPATGSPG